MTRLFGKWCFLAAAGWLLCAAAPRSAGAGQDDPGAMLEQADRIRTSDHDRFVRLLGELDRAAARLSPAQAWHLRYLDAWEAAYVGDYPRATKLAMAVMDGAKDITLRARAGATTINMLGLGHRYDEAYARLDQLLEQLPQVTDHPARVQIESEASQLYSGAGQYDLAVDYADRMRLEDPSPRGRCRADYYALHARYLSGSQAKIEQALRQAIDGCVGADDTLFADGIRGDLAGVYLASGRADAALVLLHANYADVVRTQYRMLIAQYSAQLAQAHEARGEIAQARRYALAAVDASVKGEYSEPLLTAYKLLYQLDARAGSYQRALAYHEKYQAADKAYLDDISAKALAYQMVRQQVAAKKAEVDALAGQNQILKLQQDLDRKAVEASRLYIAVLLLGLLAIGLWLLRLKRSQLQFMRMAQCDSLTGIYNRKHFMAEAEQALSAAKRAGRNVSLVLIDLDHFKLTNDTYGHAIGDQVLRRAVAVCQEQLRTADVFGRLGGEEFGVLLPDCPIDGGIERAEALRRAIRAVSDEEDPGIPVSASLGVACTGESGYELRELLVDADSALYRAKRAGRNCVVAGKPTDSIVVA